MTKYTAEKAKTETVGRVPFVSKLVSWIERAIERHHRRAASLRVYDARRLDGRSTGANPDTPAQAPESLAETAREVGHLFAPLSRLANWFGAVYAAHEARIIALRAYARSRS